MNLRSEIIYQANLTPNTYVCEIYKNLKKRGVETTEEYISRCLKEKGFMVKNGICYNPVEEYLVNKQYLDRKYWRTYKQDIIEKSKRNND